MQHSSRALPVRKEPVSGRGLFLLSQSRKELHHERVALRPQSLPSLSQKEIPYQEQLSRKVLKRRLIRRHDVVSDDPRLPGIIIHTADLRTVLPSKRERARNASGTDGLKPVCVAHHSCFYGLRFDA